MRCFRILRSKKDSLSRLEQSGCNNDNDPDREINEEANRKIWQSWRTSVRWALKQAESALTITAFVVAMAAIVLHMGGHVALVSIIGLDFATNNPELTEQLDQALTFFDTSLGPICFRCCPCFSFWYPFWGSDSGLGGLVLIVVFTSQLASETWDSVKKEIDNEEKIKEAQNAALPQADIKEDDLLEGLFGTNKLSYKKADTMLTHLIEQEYKVQLWNITSEELPRHLDPAFIDTSSPEIKNAYQFDFDQSIIEGLVFSPKLIQAIIKYCDPSYEHEELLQKYEIQIKDFVILPAFTLGKISQGLVPTKTDQFETSLKSLADLRSEVMKELESMEEK